MASVNSVSSNNLTSSLYNSANVISGLASGLDTEGMIEGLVQSYQTKIQNLTNSATKLEWKQEAYRSIIAKMNAFSNKYTSYTSGTNLMSSSFFNSAIKVAAQGKYADKVTASGRTDSDVKLNSVTQLATAARYTTNSNLDINAGFDITAEDGVKFTDKVDMGTLSGSLTLNYGGKTVSISFDANTDMIDNDLSAKEKAEQLGKMIRSKLADSKITLTSGESKDATDLIDVSVDSSGKISFKDKSTAGNSVYISGASGTVESVLGLDLEDVDENKPNSFQVKDSTRLTQQPTVSSLISGKTMNISLDGKSKTIYLPRITTDSSGNYVFTTPTVGKDSQGYPTVTYEAKNARTVKEGENFADVYAEVVNAAVQKEFGNKITVSNVGGKDEKGNDVLKLSIEAPENSSMIINSDAGKALGIGNVATNYLNTSKTLGEVGKSIDWSKMTLARDSKGNVLKDKNGDELYELVINGKTVGSGYNKNSKLSDMITDINNSDAGVKLSYSQTTRNFTFTTKDTGSENGIEISGGLAGAIFGSTKVDTSAVANTSAKSLLGLEDMSKKELHFTVDGKDIDYTIQGTSPSMQNILDSINSELKKKGIDGTASFSDKDGSLIVTSSKGKQLDVEINEPAEGDTNDITKELFDKVSEKFAISGYTAGQDAEFEVEVNGQTMKMTRASNSANIDGMTINFKSTFTAEEGDEVTFQTSTDSDKIVDAIKSMITDYNEMMAEIRTQYATMPYQDSSGAFKSYEPLSDDDKASMSESAIQNYEAKAKQGILFNDSNLSTLYDRMRAVFSPGGADEALLQQMGITVGYSSSDGSSYITLDENKLRDMLENDADTVAELFTRSVDAGAESNGIMQGLKVQLDRYAGLTGATKGILVQQAGTPLSSLTLMSNTWQTQIDNLGTQVETWQDKLSAQVDKYTSMFSKLETLIYQMNSQSSTLAGLMGG